MDNIYSALITVDFSDAITGGLRRNTDMVRGVLERTRGMSPLLYARKRCVSPCNSLSGALA